MSDKVKLIIEIPKATYEDLKSGKIYSSLCEAPQGLIEGIRNGTLLDSNSERAEVQAYFDGEAYGWEQGRKALIDDAKAEINEEREFARDDFRQYKIEVLGVDPETVDDELPHDDFHRGMERVLEIIDNIGKAESEGVSE